MVGLQFYELYEGRQKFNIQNLFSVQILSKFLIEVFYDEIRNVTTFFDSWILEIYVRKWQHLTRVKDLVNIAAIVQRTNLTSIK